MRRRKFLGAAAYWAAAGLIAPAVSTYPTSRANADDKVIRVGTLKLIIGMTPFLYEKVAEPGYRFEVTVFDSPSDVTAAVATRSVDVGMVGYPVAVLAFSNGQPITVIGASTDGGFGIVANAKSDITSLAELKGKRVAVQPASTVETLFRLRMKEVGLAAADVETVRLMFQDMPAALQRGDIDAYVGIEPGPSISVLNKSGKIIDLPYHTAAGGLNLVLIANPEIIEKNADGVKAFLRTHRRAVEAARVTPSLYIDAAVARLGVARPLAELAMKNIYVQWQIDDKWMAQTAFYNQAMIDVKQIKQLPDMAKFANVMLIDEIAKEK